MPPGNLARSVLNAQTSTSSSTWLLSQSVTGFALSQCRSRARRTVIFRPDAPPPGAPEHIGLDMLLDLLAMTENQARRLAAEGVLELTPAGVSLASVHSLLDLAPAGHLFERAVDLAQAAVHVLRHRVTFRTASERLQHHQPDHDEQAAAADGGEQLRAPRAQPEGQLLLRGLRVRGGCQAAGSAG